MENFQHNKGISSECKQLLKYQSDQKYTEVNQFKSWFEKYKEFAWSEQDQKQFDLFEQKHWSLEGVQKLAVYSSDDSKTQLRAQSEEFVKETTALMKELNLSLEAKKKETSALRHILERGHIGKLGNFLDKTKKPLDTVKGLSKEMKNILTQEASSPRMTDHLKKMPDARDQAMQIVDSNKKTIDNAINAISNYLEKVGAYLQEFKKHQEFLYRLNNKYSPSPKWPQEYKEKLDLETQRLKGIKEGLQKLLKINNQGQDVIPYSSDLRYYLINEPAGILYLLGEDIRSISAEYQKEKIYDKGILAWEKEFKSDINKHWNFLQTGAANKPSTS